MTDITIRRVNETYIQVVAERSIIREAHEHFSFLVPNHIYHPLVKEKMWDGRIRLLNASTGQIYAGLQHRVAEWAKLNGYSFTGVDDSCEIAEEQVSEFIKSIPLKHTPYYFQTACLSTAIKNHRNIFECSTGSGKSLIAFLIILWHLCNGAERTLLIVPSSALVRQMNTDFRDYWYDHPYNVHEIMEGAIKKNTAPITVATWQSIYKMPKSWFAKFDVVTVDECHEAKAKSLTTIMEKCENTKYRYGLTGSLDDSVTNQIVLEGLFGPVFKPVTTKELIEKEILSDMRIRCCILEYDDADRKLLAKAKYEDEKAWLEESPKRNRFIINLTKSMQGNTLVLYHRIDHGKKLFEAISASVKGRNVYLINGSVNVDMRDKIRGIVEKDDSAIIVASYGTFSRGINIKRIHNIVFGIFSKSKIRVLQSIGRGLRKSNNKMLRLFDISDDLVWKKHNNYSIKHLEERLKYYVNQEFEYSFHKYKVK